VKWLLLSFVALILVIMIVLGGGFAWIMNVKTDVNDPQFAEKFQKGLEGLCFQQAKSEVARSGAALDYQQEALVKQVCACDMKAVMNILAKKGAKTPVDLQKAFDESQQETGAAFQSCAQAYGLQ
jgi:K+-transporting ATPase A subunit